MPREQRKLPTLPTPAATLTLNPSSSGDTLTFNGVSNDYAGKVQITSLTGADPNVDLEDLFNTGGALITSTNFISSLSSNGTGETLHLMGGGSIAFRGDE